MTSKFFGGWINQVPAVKIILWLNILGFFRRLYHLFGEKMVSMMDTNVLQNDATPKSTTLISDQPVICNMNYMDNNYKSL